MLHQTLAIGISEPTTTLVGSTSQAAHAYAVTDYDDEPNEHDEEMGEEEDYDDMEEEEFGIDEEDFDVDDDEDVDFDEDDDMGFDDDDEYADGSSSDEEDF